MVNVGWPELLGAGIGVFGVVTAVVKTIVSPHIATVKDHGERLSYVEKHGATRESLKETESTILQAIHQVNGDIINRIGAVDHKADEAHSRINRALEQEVERLRAERRT